MPHFDHGPSNGNGGGVGAVGSSNGNAAAAAEWIARQQQPMKSQQDKIKCVFLGDGAVGKTSLIISYTTNGYPSEYVPTAIDTYDVVVHVDGEPVTFEMCDTPGQDDFDTLRPLCYANTDVFLLCFSVVSPSSFQNVKEKWILELKKSHKGKAKTGGGRKRGKLPPIILVGTQSDLREDARTLHELGRAKEQPITEAEAKKFASSMGAESYVESSSLTQKNLKEVFDQAIIAGLAERRRRARSLAKKRAKTKSGPRRPSCIRGSGGDDEEAAGEAAGAGEAAAVAAVVRGERRRCTIL